MIHSHKQQGFTLIELMLSIAFIGFIMIFVVTTIVQVMRTYNKGLAVKEISQIARTSLDDIARSARNADITEVTSLTATAKNRLCMGGVSYIWNTRNSSDNRYTDNNRVTFVRVNDLGGTLCRETSPGNYPRVLKANTTQLLTDKVWVNKITAVKQVNGHVLDLNLQLSTADDTNNALDLTANPVTCKGGNQGDFCAVANFTTTVVLKGN